MAPSIHSFRIVEASKVLRLWEAAFGSEWALDEETFLQACCTHGGSDRFINLVASIEARVVGFISAQIGSEDRAGVLVVAVHPDFQRRGVGRSLLFECVRELSKRGAKSVSVGSGGHSYLWPGVPMTSTSGLSFFSKSGWTFTEELYDMVVDLGTISPSELTSVVGADTRQLAEGEQETLLQFFKEHFPYWKTAYEKALRRNQLKDIIVAVSSSGELAGGVLAFTNASGYYENGLAWRVLHGASMGGFAVLGVREDLRGQGIGLRLAAHATLELQRRGVKCSLAGWTYLERLYGKIGYKVWRRYAMSDKRALERNERNVLFG